MTKRTKIVTSLGIAFLLMFPCVARAQKADALLKGGERLLGTSPELAHTVERAAAQQARSGPRYVIIERANIWYLVREGENLFDAKKPLQGKIPVSLEQAVATGNLEGLKALNRRGVKISTSQSLNAYFEAEMRLLEAALPHPATLEYLLTNKNIAYRNNAEAIGRLLLKATQGGYAESFFVLLAKLPSHLRLITEIHKYVRLAFGYEKFEMAVSIMEKYKISPSEILRYYDEDLSTHRQIIDFLKQYELEHP